MASHGKIETEKLIGNLESQLGRLVQQLEDLENCRDELDTAEYDETKQDTMEQLNEFNDSLERLVKGDVSLISSLGAIKLATRAAISEAFKTPEVIRLFGKREPKQLRERLTNIEHDFKLGKVSKEFTTRQKAETLIALRQLGEKLTPGELQFVEHWMSTSDKLKNIELLQLVEDE